MTRRPFPIFAFEDPLTAPAGLLQSPPSNHALPLGARWSDGRASFGVWAPNATAVSVLVGDDRDGVELSPDDRGNWWGELACQPGDEYLFRLVGADGEVMERIDPRALAVTNSVGRGIIVDQRYDWQDEGFAPRPINEWVIYELHPTTFAGDLEGVLDRLGYLSDLGVTAIELMPVAEFAGDLSWGYNPAHPFAVESAYGGPAALKRLVDAAHQAGIAVILDVVYNHFGPSDLDLWRFDGWYENDGGGIYFYNDWRAETAWGATRPDYGRDEVRQFVLDNALMWLTEYHIDGLRLDSTVNIRNAKGEPGPDGDLEDGWRLLADLVSTIRGATDGKVLIAEDLQGDPRITRSPEEGGLGFDLQWAAGFVHPVRAVLEAGDADAVEVARTIVAGEAFSEVVYTESHDEVANGRTRVPAEVDADDPGSWSAFRRAALGAVLMMAAPQVPMLFQGQEWADEDWFDDQKDLDWSRGEQRPGTVNLWRDLIALRTGGDPRAGGLRGDQCEVVSTSSESVLALWRWGIGGADDASVVVANLSGQAVSDVRVPVPSEGRWHSVFVSTWSGYHPTGSDSTAPEAAAMTDGDGGAYLMVELDSYAAAIYVPSG